MEVKGILMSICDSFLKINGSIFAVIALGLTIFLWVYPPGTKIPLYIIVGLGSFILLGFLILGNIIKIKHEENKKLKMKCEDINLPRVISVKNAGKENICILEKSDLFSYDHPVSLYYLEDGFEKLISLGVVENIQTNGMIQIRIVHQLEEYSEINKKLLENNLSILKNVKVRPNVPYKYFEF